MSDADPAAPQYRVVALATVHAGMSTKANQTRSISPGQIVTVFETGQSEGHQRARISGDEWVSISTAKGSVLLEPFDGSHEGSAIRALVWIDEHTLASGAFDGRVLVWSLHSNRKRLPDTQVELRLQTDLQDSQLSNSKAHDGAVTSIVQCSSVEGTTACYLASASDDRTVKVWTRRQPGLPQLIVRRLHTGGICQLAWLPCPQGPFGPAGWLATASADSTIKILALRGLETGSPHYEEMGHLRGHDGPVHALRWDQQNALLRSGSADRTIRTWRLLPTKKWWFTDKTWWDMSRDDASAFALADALKCNKIFAFFDADGDGYLNFSELQSLAHKTGGDIMHGEFARCALADVQISSRRTRGQSDYLNVEH